MAKIPQFKSDREAAVFWETHSLADFEEDLVVVKGVSFERRGRRKPMSCDCDGRYEEAVRDFDGIACPAMVCGSCGDVVFTIEQSKRYRELRLERMVEKVTPENRHEEIPTSPLRPARKYHKWADLEKKLFTPERLAEIDREVAKEIKRMRRREIKRRLDMPYTLEFTRNSDGSFFVKVKEFRGCMSEGDTIEEAYAMIRDAMAGWMKAMLEDRKPIPEPRSKRR